MFLKRLLVILLASLFVFDVANAFTLSPTKYLVTIAPGGSKTIEVEVKNDSQNTETYGFSVVQVEQDDAGHSIISNSKDYTALAWVKPEKTDVTISPGASGSMKYIIDIPEDVSAGSYYLGLTAYPLVSGDKKIGLNAQLATVLYLKVAGVVNESLNVLSWKTSKINFNKNLKFSLKLQNSGNMEVDMVGKFSLKKSFGREVYNEQISVGSMLLSGEDREIVFSPTQKLSLKPGFYHADLQVVYGQSKQIVTGSYTFWYLPWWSLLIIFVLVLTPLVYLIKKHSFK